MTNGDRPAACEEVLGFDMYHLYAFLIDNRRRWPLNA